MIHRHIPIVLGHHFHCCCPHSPGLLGYFGAPLTLRWLHSAGQRDLTGAAGSLVPTQPIHQHSARQYYKGPLTMQAASYNAGLPLTMRRGLKQQSMQDSWWGRLVLSRRLGWGFSRRPRAIIPDGRQPETRSGRRGRGGEMTVLRKSTLNELFQASFPQLTSTSGDCLLFFYASAKCLVKHVSLHPDVSSSYDGQQNILVMFNDCSTGSLPTDGATFQSVSSVSRLV